MKMFSKLKDYNAIVEEILEKKTFPSMAKSLILSLIYKLEISYNDYSIVKKGLMPKKAFFDNIINTIDEYCDNLVIVEPNSVQAELLKRNKVIAVTNIKERSIMSYPTEEALWYGLLDIEPKYFYIKKDFLLKDVFQRLLVNAYKQNSIEIIKNFNGWSWAMSIGEKDDYISNIIYQNFIVIIGESFLNEWRNSSYVKKDYIKEIKDEVYKLAENDDYYISLCKLLYLVSSDYEKSVIKTKVEKMMNEYKSKELSSYQKQQLKENIKFYTKLINNKKNDYEELIDLQKQFLIIIQKKIENADSIEEMKRILFEIRYYQNLEFYEGILIKNFRDIKNILNCVQKLAIFKACNLNAIKIITVNVEDNFNILKYIMDTRIINLQEIRISIDYDDEYIYIKVYDKEIFEKQGKCKYDGNKKNIQIKKNKMIKLFN